MKAQWLELKDDESKKKFVQDRITHVRRNREVGGNTLLSLGANVVSDIWKHGEELERWQEQLKQHKALENETLKKKRVKMYVISMCYVATRE